MTVCFVTYVIPNRSGWLALPQLRPSRQANLGVGQHTQCVHTGLWRGDAAPNAAPPFEPPAPAPLPEQRRAGAPPPDPCTAARLAHRRTVVVAARVMRADLATTGFTEALHLPNAGEANDVVSVGVVARCPRPHRGQHGGRRHHRSPTLRGRVRGLPCGKAVPRKPKSR